jgi:ABC-type branched-subunit amino acid transport system ATPase component
MTRPLLRTRGLTRRYGRGGGLVRAVDEVDLSVPAGQSLAIMGPSGCGKSTLLHLLGGLQRPTAGQVWLAGQRIDTMSERALARLRRDHVGFVFQSFHLMDELTAVENVELAALLAGQSPRRARRRAMVAVVHLAEYLVIGLAAAGTGLAAGLLAAPALIEPSAGLLGTANAQAPTLRTVVAAIALAIAIAVAAAMAPVVRAATTSTMHALADAATPPRRRRWHIQLSRRLPTALLIGVRVNARRPRRARLVVVNTLITTTALVAVLMSQAQDKPFNVGGSELVNPIEERTRQAIFFVTVVLCVLALLNAVVNTWTAVLDARGSLTVARTLGATPGQAAAGLAVAQLLPALPGVAAGVPAGIGLFVFAGHDEIRYPPDSWLLAAALGVLLAVTALTAIPALAVARRPVADTLRAMAA